MMRYHILLLLSIFMLTACEEVDKFTQFTMDYNSEVTIKSTTGVDVPVQLQTPEIQSNAESEFEVNDTRKDLVEEILLQESTLTITQPEDGDFSFLKSIKLYINADGLERQLIASKEDIPDNVGDVLELEVNEVNLKDYVQKESFVLETETVTDEVISQDHEIDIYAQFWVDAEILGQ